VWWQAERVIHTELRNEKVHPSQMLETVNTGKNETESSSSVLGGIWGAHVLGLARTR